ncbi:hypothetical protein OAA60_05140 [Porticoccaceae bacterium]|jgi:hypothetical protein|nr:hypothetical protein [Porticoccaceae bacterium]
MSSPEEALKTAVINYLSGDGVSVLNKQTISRYSTLFSIQEMNDNSELFDSKSATLNDNFTIVDIITHIINVPSQTLFDPNIIPNRPDMTIDIYNQHKEQIPFNLEYSSVPIDDILLTLPSEQINWSNISQRRDFTKQTILDNISNMTADDLQNIINKRPNLL